MRKALFVLALFPALGLVGVSSCEEKLDGAYGIHVTTNPDGSKSITLDPSGGPVGSGVKLAADAAGGFPGPGTLIGYGLAAIFGTGGLVQTVLKNRATAALNATSAGLASYSAANPGQAHELRQAIDQAHDAHDIHPTHQDAIQSSIVVPTPAPA